MKRSFRYVCLFLCSGWNLTVLAAVTQKAPLQFEQLIQNHLPPQTIPAEIKQLPKLMRTPQQRLHAETLRRELIQKLYKLPQNTKGDGKKPIKQYRIYGFYYPESSPQMLMLFTGNRFIPLRQLYPQARVLQCTPDRCRLSIKGAIKTLRLGQLITPHRP